MKNYLERSVQSLAFISTLCGLFAGPAQAIDHEMTATFNPDPTNPRVNKFVNTTPNSSICNGHIPAMCKQLNLFSLESRSFRAQNNATMPAFNGVADPRKAVMFKVPSDWRAFPVTHMTTGEPAIVEMRMAGIGGQWSGPHVTSWDVPDYGSGRWDFQWRVPRPPCLPTTFFAAGLTSASFFWVVPEGAGACAVYPGVDVPALRYNGLHYAYELRTPNPLTMSTGKYQGTQVYTIGPGGDFDFGDYMNPNDSLMTFNFTLNVEHTLKVEVPPGGNRVELVPQGGWQAWLQRNRKPERLFRDQTFNLSASSRFRMQLECQYGDGGNTCMLHEPNSGDAVPVNISVTLPNGMTDEAGQPVNRRPLLRDGSGTEHFKPSLYVDRKPGALHFEIARPAVEEMLTGSAKTYSGNVTVIWDSEI